MNRIDELEFEIAHKRGQQRTLDCSIMMGLVTGYRLDAALQAIDDIADEIWPLLRDGSLWFMAEPGADDRSEWLPLPAIPSDQES